MERGKLEVFTGPMRGGKTKTMFFEINKAQEHGAGKAIIFKPITDTRTPNGRVSTYGNGESKAAIEIPAEEPQRMIDIFFELKARGESFDIIGIDEIQFFHKNLYWVVDVLLDMGVDIYAAGLETNFKAEPFETTLNMMPLVKHMSYWHRILPYCDNCHRMGKRKLAFFTQRLYGGEPAPWNDKIELPGDTIPKKSFDEPYYEARCKECYIPPPGKPTWKRKTD